jgi:hypothetical protein
MSTERGGGERQREAMTERLALALAKAHGGVRGELKSFGSKIIDRAG